jgi:hypothetical protein
MESLAPRVEIPSESSWAPILANDVNEREGGKQTGAVGPYSARLRAPSDIFGLPEHWKASAKL